jgi:hypothetical protein
MTGEYGHRKGTAFEQSISAMLTYLGFKIVRELTSIDCCNDKHKAHESENREHSVDFLAQHMGNSPSPFCCFDGLTFFDCTASENLSEAQFTKASETLDCLRKTKECSGVKGAIVVTSRALTPPLKREMMRFKDMLCWDISRLNLYGAMAEVQNMSKRWKSNTKTDVRADISGITIVRRGSFTWPFQFYEGDIFHEGEQPLNRDSLKRLLLPISSMTRFNSVTYLRVHSLNGFTSDLPRLLGGVIKESSTRLRTIVIRPDDLYDYTRPWFAAFSFQQA